jgi:hypothetical protein
VRRLTGLTLLCLIVTIVLHGCGGFDPLVAGEVRIFDASTEQLARGVLVRWSTTVPASSRIDYGPAEAATKTFYQPEKNGIGLDCDGHVMSQTRTNCTTVGPVMNTVADFGLRVRHSLVATEATTSTTNYFAITSQDLEGQVATLTVTLPRANPLVGGFPNAATGGP